MFCKNIKKKSVPFFFFNKVAGTSEFLVNLTKVSRTVSFTEYLLTAAPEKHVIASNLFSQTSVKFSNLFFKNQIYPNVQTGESDKKLSKDIVCTSTDIYYKLLFT